MTQLEREAHTTMPMTKSEIQSAYRLASSCRIEGLAFPIGIVRSMAVSHERLRMENEELNKEIDALHAMQHNYRITPDNTLAPVITEKYYPTE